MIWGENFLTILCFCAWTLQNEVDKMQFHILQDWGESQESTFTWFQGKSTVKKTCLIQIIRLYMSLSEACFHLHLSFLSQSVVQEDPEERSCCAAHSHSEINTMQRNKTWHNSRFEAHSLYVTFSDIQHCAPAKHAVLKQSLCSIAALLC